MSTSSTIQSQSSLSSESTAGTSSTSGFVNTFKNLQPSLTLNQAAGPQSLNNKTSAVATATALANTTIPGADGVLSGSMPTEGPNTGAIVGALIGVITVLGLVAGFLLYRRKYMSTNRPKTDSERAAIEANTQFLPSTPIARPIVRSILCLSDTDFSISESVAFQLAHHIKQHAQVLREKHVRVTNTNDVLSALKADVDNVVFVTQKAGRIQETKTGEILRVLEQHCQSKLQVVFYDFSRSRNQPILNVSTFTLSVQGNGCLEEIPTNDAALKDLIEKLRQV
ncbi:hypothetical protein HDU77_008376 [Chytriomyces hyalinus]|nr:hypothetical protein HDU77_008376 [Chytriomyces hyalinus]